MRTIKYDEDKEVGFDQWNEYVIEDNGNITKKIYVRVYSKGIPKVYVTNRKLPKGYDHRN